MASNTSKVRFIAQVLVGILLLAAAQINIGSQGQLQAAERPKAQPVEYFALPGYSALARKDVRDELGLSAEQFTKLQEISKNYWEAVRQPGAKIDWTKLSAEERKKKMEELTAENKKRSEEARKQVAKVLTPEQVKKAEMIELRVYAPQFLLYGQATEKLGLTDEQKQHLRQSREDLQKKMTELQQQMQKLQEQAGKDALQMLTPEQVEKLKQLQRDGFSGFIRPPVEVTPKP